jgi:hypothetical protein
LDLFSRYWLLAKPPPRDDLRGCGASKKRREAREKGFALKFWAANHFCVRGAQESGYGGNVVTCPSHDLRGSSELPHLEKSLLPIFSRPLALALALAVACLVFLSCLALTFFTPPTPP